MSIKEIEIELAKRGEYVQISEMSTLLRKAPSLEIKRYLCLKLAKLYEKKGMLNETAKMYDNLAIIGKTKAKKIEYYIEESKAFIKAGYFERSDEARRMAQGPATAKQKEEIYHTIKEFYKEISEGYEKVGKVGNSKKIYEKLLEMKLKDKEKEEIEEKLTKIYKSLGRRGSLMYKKF